MKKTTRPQGVSSLYSLTLKKLKNGFKKLTSKYGEDVTMPDLIFHRGEAEFRVTCDTTQKEHCMHKRRL